MLEPLAKSVLIPSRLTPAGPAADAWINKKELGSGKAKLIISNEKIENIQKYLISRWFWFSSKRCYPKI